ncbi:hypothetical protein [Sphingobium sp. MK2]|uniref:hypothetical protein n=1 Tax=Sphingobium sp. MK2 TaxID=3116540 RepID=UPI0032E360E3
MSDASPFPLPYDYNSIFDDVRWKELPEDGHPFIPMTSLPKTSSVAERSTLLQTPYHLDDISEDKTHHDLLEMPHGRALIQKRLNDLQARYYEAATGASITTANPPVEPLSIDAMLEWFRVMDEMMHRSKADQIKKLMQAGVMVTVNRNMPDGTMVMTVGRDYERAVEIALEEFAKEKARG